MALNEYIRGFGLGAVMASVVALAAPVATQAATLTEAESAAGNFSRSWSAPTEIGNGYENVAGTGWQNDPDIFVFTGLRSGRQDLVLNFTAPEGIDQSYSAGGSVNYGFSPFKHEWDGQAADWVQVDYYTREKSVVVSLGESFAGALYLALNFTHGSNLAYNISAPGNAALTPTAPIPLPAGVLLIGSAIGVIGLVRARSRRQAVA